MDETGHGYPNVDIELSFAGQPVRNLRELLAICCTEEES
jgi:hypothetical protein